MRVLTPVAGSIQEVCPILTNAEEDANGLKMTAEQFQKIASQRLAFLEKLGFHRATIFEDSSSLSSEAVYLGKNLGFVFSFDYRDQCVDAQVVKVCNGRIKPKWEGGYSSDLFFTS